MLSGRYHNIVWTKRVLHGWGRGCGDGVGGTRDFVAFVVFVQSGGVVEGSIVLRESHRHWRQVKDISMNALNGF